MHSTARYTTYQTSRNSDLVYYQAAQSKLVVFFSPEGGHIQVGPVTIKLIFVPLLEPNNRPIATHIN